MKTDLFINGDWRPAADGRTFAVYDPASEQVLTNVADGGAEDALAAVGAAANALPLWSARSPRARGEILRRAFDLMIERRDDLARLIVRENGKALRDAIAEVNYAAEFFRWNAEEAVRALGEVSLSPNGANHILVQLQPIGVSLLVTPWNFPAAMATRKIGPALAAGCTVVLKPASETPLTALAIADLLASAGVPAGVVNVVPATRSSVVVRQMLRDSRVRKLSFTGSTEVGRLLLAQAAERVVSCSMELGGNAPFIVLDDADIDEAVQGAIVAKMRNGGQACTAANRFFIQRGIASAFVERLVYAMSDLKVGNGLDAGVDVGPLVNAAARDKVHELVQDAVARGGRMRLGGAAAAGHGYFYPPTVLDRVPRDARMLREEIFGPVAPIVEFDDDVEAVRLANDTEYGLVSYLYTKDLRRGLALADRLDAGMVGLNRGLVSDPAAPFGGTKQSGIGREGGHDGLLEFLEKKYIAVEW
jgi:succinate-semialdehyde dehydrogenase / glutarate-semialdehyde dehydrogenase